MFMSAPFASARRYLGKMQILRDEARTRRLLGGLPRSIQKDIGWPDSFVDRRNRIS